MIKHLYTTHYKTIKNQRSYKPSR